MRRIISALAALALLGVAQAATTVGANFQTRVSFTPTCVAAAGGVPTLDFGNYTAFGSTVNAAAVNFSFNCSRGTSILAAGLNSALPNANGSFGLFPSNNLHYTLALTGGLVGLGGTQASAANGNIGSPDVYSYAVSGTLPQQAGRVGGVLPESVTRSVVFVF